VKTTRAGTPFIVIGENIHATRSLSRSGKHIVAAPDGRAAVAFTDTAGAPRLLAIPDEVQQGGDFAAGKVKHVRSAILAARSPDPAAADAGRAYLLAMAARQVAAGADYIDLNVDEVSPDVAERAAAMRWLVGMVGAAVSVPVSIDSSASEVIAAGVEAASQFPGRPLINSASLERPAVLDLAAAAHCPVVLGAVGEGGMPAGAAERVANGIRIVEEATRRGLDLSQLYLDPLVIPVGVEPEAGAWYLEAVRRLREHFGPQIHLTGGLSNVSFGLPARRILNDTFIDLAAEAGVDSGIIDPLANDLDRIFRQDRTSRPYQLAADVLTGRDPYGGEYLAAFRAGQLGGGGA
jgi:cobalamin-dependent methionine synthase I